MSKTASMVMKIIGASLAFAAFVCLLIGGWHDLSVGCCGMKTALAVNTTIGVFLQGDSLRSFKWWSVDRKSVV